jgi:peptide/nickel transport system substrate-binding protein
MKKTLIMMITLLLLLPAFVFAGGAEEEIVDIEAVAGDTLFEGVRDIDLSEGWERGRYGGRIVFPELNSGPRSFNRVIATETSSTNILDQMYDPLLRRDQFTLDPEPWVATSYRVSADNKTVTWTIPSGLRWSDGDDLTAKDFVFGLNQLVLREDIGSNLRSGNLMVPEGGTVALPFIAEYINDTTLSVTLPDVTATLLLDASLTPFPMHIFAPVIGWNEEEHGLAYEYEIGQDEEGNDILVEIKPEGVDYAAVNSFWGVDTNVRSVVGNGPWVIDEYIPDQRVIMTPNPYYWNTDEWGQQLPYLDEIVFEIIPDQDTMYQRFIAGTVDTLPVRGEDYAGLVNRQEELDFSLWNTGANTGTLFITVNQNPIEGEDDAGLGEPQINWLSNLTFRRAVAHLIDRETMINNIYFGFGYPQYSQVPRVSPFYWEGVDDVYPDYDPAEAARLLDSIDYIDRDGDGWREDPDGNRITIELVPNSGNNIRESIAELVSQEARNIGLDLVAAPKDFNAMVGQLLSSFDYEMIVIGLTSGDPDPTATGIYPSSGNLHMIEPYQVTPRRAWEARVDELHAAQRRELDLDARKEMWVEIQQLWAENLPMIYLVAQATMSAIPNEFGNYYPQNWQGYGIRDFAEYIYIK